MADQKKWQFFNAKSNKWNKLPKGAYAKKKEDGVAVCIQWPNGSRKVIANASAAPEGSDFSKKAADRAAAK